MVDKGIVKMRKSRLITLFVCVVLGLSFVAVGVALADSYTVAVDLSRGQYVESYLPSEGVPFYGPMVFTNSETSVVLGFVMQIQALLDNYQPYEPVSNCLQISYGVEGFSGGEVELFSDTYIPIYANSEYVYLTSFLNEYDLTFIAGYTDTLSVTNVKDYVDTVYGWTTVILDQIPTAYDNVVLPITDTVGFRSYVTPFSCNGHSFDSINLWAYPVVFTASSGGSEVFDGFLFGDADSPAVSTSDVLVYGGLTLAGTGAVVGFGLGITQAIAFIRKVLAR